MERELGSRGSWHGWRRATGVWLLAGLPALAQAGQTGAETAPRLRVELTDASGLSETIRSAVLREANEVLANCTVRLVPADPDSDLHVRVYLMESIPPSLARRHQAFGNGDPMGITLPQANAAPVVYLSVRAIRDGLRRHGVAASDVHMARALGRVLAHEIGHVLLGPTHKRRGLLRASLDAGTLTARQAGTLVNADERAALNRAAVHLTTSR